MIYYSPTKDLTITLAAYDNDGLPTTPAIDKNFNGQTGFAAEARLTGHFCSLTRHQTLGVYPTGSTLAFDQNPPVHGTIWISLVESCVFQLGRQARQ
jgi:hypothetical protein